MVSISSFARATYSLSFKLFYLDFEGGSPLFKHSNPFNVLLNTNISLL